MNKAEGVALLMTLAHDTFRCGCLARGRLCVRCACMEEIARAMCHACFTRDDLRVLYAVLTEPPLQEETPHA